jgi:hypothetical protein
MGQKNRQNFLLTAAVLLWASLAVPFGIHSDTSASGSIKFAPSYKGPSGIFYN